MITEKTKEKEKEILALAEHTLYYTDLLIKQCDSWLPEDEGLKNAEKRVKEKNKKISL